MEIIASKASVRAAGESGTVEPDDVVKALTELGFDSYAKEFKRNLEDGDKGENEEGIPHKKRCDTKHDYSKLKKRKRNESESEKSKEDDKESNFAAKSIEPKKNEITVLKIFDHYNCDQTEPCKQKTPEEDKEIPKSASCSLK